MIRIFSILGGLLLAASDGIACEIVMGYRTNERPPLIETAPNNNGLYLDLYSKAAEQIGCTLKIVRAPKKRILQNLREGTIDFYPGFNYTDKRAEYVYYIENGLPGGDIGISHKGLPEITDLKQLHGHSIVMPIGSPNFVKDIQGIKLIEKSELTTEKAVNLINKERVDFYIYNRDTLLYHLKTHKPKNIKVHFECCGGEKPLYLGFSMRSRHFNATSNPSYNPDIPQSADNSPIEVSDGVAKRFKEALHDMKSSHTTKAVYSFYYD